MDEDDSTKAFVKMEGSIICNVVVVVAVCRIGVTPKAEDATTSHEQQKVHNNSLVILLCVAGAVGLGFGRLV